MQHFYLINVNAQAGTTGYSFMVSTDTDMDCAVMCGDGFDIITAAANADLFAEECDMCQCSVSVADENDQKHFKVCTDISEYLK